MSDVSSVTSFFSTSNEGFTTTLGSNASSGATTIVLASVSGLTNGKVFVGIIEPGGTKQQVFTGIVNTGTLSITGVVWTRGTNVAHTAGVTIVDYVTGTDHNMMTAGILVSHNQDGTLKTNAISTAAMLVDGVVSTAKLATNAVTKATTVWDEQTVTYSNATQTLGATGITGSLTTSGYDLLLLVEGSYYMSAGSKPKFNLKIGSTSYTFRGYTNELNSHKSIARTILATGITANTYTCTLEACADAVATTLNLDTNDYWRLTVLEIKK